jgi:4a-hydroxytetrahydrobiopterin dehydratase
MSDKITPQEFHSSEGTGDWRVLGASRDAAYAVFRSGSFAAGVRLVDAIGELADALDHHPDVDLRYGTVSVRTWSHDVVGLSRRDVELARQISDAARELEVPADPAAPTELHLAVDAHVGSDVEPFWRAVLGYSESAEVPKWDAAPQLDDPAGRMPGFWFQPMEAPRTERNRIHVDVWVPYDVAEQRVADAVAAGGRVVSDRWAPAWWVLADAEGNEACVCTTQEPTVGWDAWLAERRGDG